MLWGLTAPSRSGPVDVTRFDYNENAGVESPEQPAIPACGQHVWDWWWELDARRTPGFDNLAPISFTEIKHWIELTGKHVAPEEIRWLIQMDNAWLRTIAQEKIDRRDREKQDAENRGR